MANDRLWLVGGDGTALLLAKGWGSGWTLYASMDALATFLRDQVDEGCDGFGRPTELRLKTESADGYAPQAEQRHRSQRGDKP